MTKNAHLFDPFAFDRDTVSRCYLVSPISGARLVDADNHEGYIDTLGLHSTRAQEHRQQAEEALRREAEETPHTHHELIAKLTVAWHLVAPTGAVIDAPCTQANALELYRAHDWIVTQLVNHMVDLGNYRPPGWTN